MLPNTDTTHTTPLNHTHIYTFIIHHTYINITKYVGAYCKIYCLTAIYNTKSSHLNSLDQNNGFLKPKQDESKQNPPTFQLRSLI